MADKKISELTNITGANLADADEFVVVDTSASETKAITYGELKKFTGTITSDGLTVDNISVDGNTVSSTTGSLVLEAAGTFTLDTNSVERLRVASNGDLSLYEDTGTTPKFFWDASAESLGIGTSSPSAPLDVVGSPGTLAEFRDGVASNFIVETSGAVTTIGNQAGSSQLAFKSSNSEAMRIDASGNVGIGTTSPSDTLDVATAVNGTPTRIRLTANDTGGTTRSGNVFFDADTNTVGFRNGGANVLHVDNSGNVLVGKTASSTNSDGSELKTDGSAIFVRSGSVPIVVNRKTDDGQLIQLRQDNTTVGSIGTYNGNIYMVRGSISGVGIAGGGQFVATDSSGASSDNTRDLGAASVRWDDVYATNGTIQTSDRNEKQQIASLTDAEMQAAKAISGLFKTFKWNDSVAEKGDAARIHSGVIAQEVEAAMSAAGLDAGRYAFFISTTWWESTEVIPAVEAVAAVEATYDEDGNILTEAVEAVEAQPERTVTHTHDTAEEAPAGSVERTRKGIRYPQLLSFIGAATEQRLASIEARLDAMEAN